ncbi:MAG TPA: VOC family protein [Sphingomonas sp.]|nr:VOC family protein [Sphingomonas sp.]
MHFPAPCPEMPVSDLMASLAYFRDRLGFAIDWADEQLGLAGVSRGNARMFLSAAAFRANIGNQPPAVLWLNLAGRDEVDALYAEWSEAGTRVAGPPAAMPWKLYEFFASDTDGNRFRVFYDFAWETK